MTNIIRKELNDKITQEDIDNIIKNTIFNVETKFDKCTVVTALLPNGFILTSSSGCVDKNNYDLRLGTEICKKKIEEQIWMLEGYFLQTLKSMCEKETE